MRNQVCVITAAERLRPTKQTMISTLCVLGPSLLRSSAHVRDVICLGYVVTLSDLGNLGEVLGSLGVLLTLIYLAIQVRHSKNLLEENRKIALSQVYGSRATSRIEDLRQSIDSPYVAKLAAEIEGISEDDYRRNSLLRKNIVHIDNMLFQNELGLVDEETRDRVTRIILKDYPTWEKYGIEANMRVKKWYREHGGT